MAEKRARRGRSVSDSEAWRLEDCEEVAKADLTRGDRISVLGCCGCCGCCRIGLREIASKKADI